MKDVAKDIAAMHGLSVEQTKAKLRSKPLTRARWHIWYIAYHQGGYGLSAISRMYDVHHTTVLYGIMRWAIDKNLPCALDLKDVDKRRVGY